VLVVPSVDIRRRATENQRQHAATPSPIQYPVRMYVTSQPIMPFILCSKVLCRAGRCEEEAAGGRVSYVTLVTSNKYVYGAVVLLHSMMKTGCFLLLLLLRLLLLLLLLLTAPSANIYNECLNPMHILVTPSVSAASTAPPPLNSD
jgi:hypothetical protein